MTVNRAAVRVASAALITAVVGAACGSSGHSNATSSTSTGSVGNASAASTTAPSTSSGQTASGPGISSSTIKIGFISSLTGDASSDYVNAAKAAEARVDLQNANGGVDGRKLQLVVRDDQSSPADNLVAAQELVSQDKVFAVIDASSFTFGAAKYLNQQGVPVTGDEFDGPEWAEQPNTNMFSWGAPTSTPFGGTYYTYDNLALFLHNQGVTKLASLAYGISPSAQQASKALIAAGAQHGITNCYQDFAIPFGGVDFTAPVLAIKSKGCNGVSAPFVEASDVALSGAVKQGGVNATQLYFTGYSSSVLTNSAARSGFDGSYVGSMFNFVTPNSATAQMLDAFAKYTNVQTGGILDFGTYTPYLGADLMVKGLQVAGQNPTRQSFITNLRQVTNYTAGGILPSPVSFANFGTVAMLPATSCEYILQLQGSKFILANNGQAICGKLVPYHA
jgi:branched-chain amino acid transport system substrate-binding protein